MFSSNLIFDVVVVVVDKLVLGGEGDEDGDAASLVNFNFFLTGVCQSLRILPGVYV